MSRFPTPRAVRAAALFFALCACFPTSALGKSPFAPSAVHLTAKGADDEMGKMTDDAAFAAFEFFAPWCPHCQNFGPTWERVAAYFNKGVEASPAGTRPTPRVTVFSVDCVAEPKLCQKFSVRGYPTVLFGTVAQFKAEIDAKGSGNLRKIPVQEAQGILAAFAKETGGSYRLDGSTLADAAETNAAAEDENAERGAASDPDPDAPDPNAHADLLDIERATIQAYREMTSAALLTSESRPAFAAFLEMLASNHPIRECADGARAIVSALDDAWPEPPERGADDAPLLSGGDRDDHAPASVHDALAKLRICGEGGEKNHGVLAEKKRGGGGWRSCAGSEEGKRGYTCGLWLLFHATSVRADGRDRTSGAAWFSALVGWIEHFFPCDDCRDHFLGMANEPGVKIETKRDAAMWTWKAHNRVNARLRRRARRGEGVGAGDPNVPKIQWPSVRECAGCRIDGAESESTGDDSEDEDEEVRWDPDATYAFLARYFHATGAPRRRPADGAWPAPTTDPAALGGGGAARKTNQSFARVPAMVVGAPAAAYAAFALVREVNKGWGKGTGRGAGAKGPGVRGGSSEFLLAKFYRAVI